MDTFYNIISTMIPPPDLHIYICIYMLDYTTFGYFICFEGTRLMCKLLCSLFQCVQVLMTHATLA